jgi:hypothetical protein
MKLCKFSHPCGEQGGRCYPAFTVLAKLPGRMLIWFFEICRIFFYCGVENADSVQKTQIMQAKKFIESGNKQHQQEKMGVLMI